MLADERSRTPADVEVPEMERLLSLALARGGTFADLYFEHQRTSSILLEEGIIRTASAGLTCGLGVRVVTGERTGYAYTDDLSWPAMARAAQTAAHIASDSRTVEPQPVSPAPVERRYAPAAIGGLDLTERIALVQRAERAGPMPVVLAPGWPGILLHEAVGHGLEGDFNRKGTSAFSGRMGQRVAAPGVSVVDDGSIPDRRGSLNVDDEGNVPARTVLIEDGILRGYLQDRLNSGLMGMAATGNGRRQGYASIPIPRMTNTFMLAGQDDTADIIRSVPRGLYAKHFGGGQVDITSGKFVFSATEAYLIEDGRIGPPVVGATLIGNGPDILTKVTRIGHDLKLDEGVGVCSKAGQHIPVGVGLPTILVSEITVGGTKQ